MTDSDKEPWDLEKFIRHYNEIAHEQAGWVFNPKYEDHDPVQLRGRYEGLDGYRTLHQYARDRFIYEQQTGVEGSD